MSIIHRASSPVASLRRVVRQLWRDLLSVYYANTPAWRWLKSGTLVVFGFFCWTGSSVLLSYRPGWGFLTYAMAYGFLLIVWGPLTHLGVVPAAIRLRRTAEHPVARFLARQASKLNLSVFLTLVLLAGTVTPGVMMFEYASPLADGGDAAPDAGADVVCEDEGDLVACHLEAVRGADRVVVTTGGEELVTLSEPPYEFELRKAELADGATGKQFVVELRDAEGETLRRYVQTVPA
ncbi:hypothetical protein [Haloparvum sedimenti]|uniref:hypothetical protein n=1 Tax=Haloparvum sedimenti TaxID=1678448 RepID=UPI00071E9943|nr:hypothetical protein [Haloparvum sedimenti]